LRLEVTSPSDAVFTASHGSKGLKGSRGRYELMSYGNDLVSMAAIAIAVTFLLLVVVVPSMIKHFSQTPLRPVVPWLKYYERLGWVTVIAIIMIIVILILANGVISLIRRFRSTSDW
jgi:heme/copper-type cytochrome/quinol oxidase subunit 2